MFDMMYNALMRSVALQLAVLTFGLSLAGCSGAFSTIAGNDGGTPETGASNEAGPGDGGVEGEAPDGADSGPEPEGGACTPGTMRCSGNGVQTCEPSSQWGGVSKCSAQACVDGACVGTCSPGATSCAGQQPQTCSASGGWQATGTSCAEATSVCAGGMCQACTCGSDSGVASCFYAVSEPTPGYGAPYPVTVMSFTPSHSMATFTATVTSPPAPDHNVVWYDLDVSAFPAGGKLTVSGLMGASGTDGSAFLVAQCTQFPESGGSIPVVENVANVPAGTTWSFGSYSFAPGTYVLHFGTEGSWSSAPGGACPTACSPGQTNTNTVTVSVQ
jgi:hypothetical protein